MKIQAYRFGAIEIDGKVYHNDVKLIGNRVIDGWWRSQGHVVALEDIKDLLAAGSEVCIFGTGAYGALRVSNEVRAAFESLGVRVVAEKTSSACDLYNQLVEQGKAVVAGLHLTC
ncbi:MAG: hypothetical protein JRI36_02110 [Deltaproteobacteria bacterium]|nr:hypothetical protein [Deltaproteobacteria bacterium]